MSGISNLFFKRLLSRLSSEEKMEISRWESQSEIHRDLSRRLSDPGIINHELRMRSIIDTERAESDMRRRIKDIDRNRRRVRRLAAAITGVAVAAVVAIVMLHESPDKTTIVKPTATRVVEIASIDDIKPGTSKAILSVGSDTIVVRDNADMAERCHENAAKIVDDKPLCLNIPVGCEFKIILEDSTEVWLNSDSKLFYPQHFASGERKVKVAGEAYFKVRKDDTRPFFVETADQMIHVYGTSFNVRDYPDDPCAFITLESGSIALSSIGNNGGEIHLSPGNQAVFDRSDNRLKMKEVNPEVITGWRHGRFIFEEQPISAIMRDLSRWYDFKYRFTDPSIEDIVFMGSIPRYAEFETAIQIIENCGDIKFSLENGVVIISRQTQ